MGRGKNEIFQFSGPKHLTKVDWENADHRRTVSASLVQAVYVVERDRQKKREASKPRAAEWYQFFNFQEKERLFDLDNSIFGVIYEFKPPTAAATAASKAPVTYVIAFRGTFIHRPSVFRDIKHDTRICLTSLNRASRFSIARAAVEKAISEVGHSNIWLAGHSLGASLATLVGKKMARKGDFLESFLFNPPILSLPIIHCVEIDKKVKKWIHIIHSEFTAELSQWVESIAGKQEDMDSFASFASWVPYLFVNRADYICHGYVEYFEKRKTMEEIGAENTERATTQTSIRALIGKSLGREVETVPILPSADLMLHGSLSSNPVKAFKAHKLRQWWQPSLQQLECKEYRYK